MLGYRQLSTQLVLASTVTAIISCSSSTECETSPLCERRLGQSSPQALAVAIADATGKAIPGTTDRDLNRFIARLKAEVPFETLSTDAGMQRLSTTCEYPCFALSEQNSPYVVVGSKITGCGTFVQLLGEDLLPHLLHESEFSSAFPYLQLMRSRKPHMRQCHLPFLEVSSWWVNVGVVYPFTRQPFAFQLANRSRGSTFVISPPQSSCGCVELSPASETCLVAGTEMTISGFIDVGQNAAFRKHIVVHIRNAQSDGANEEETDTLVLAVFGNQFPLIQVSPRVVDFGIVDVGSRGTCSLTIHESAYDRFDLRDITYEGRSVISGVTAEADEKGCRRFEASIAVEFVDAIEHGAMLPFLELVTSSEFNPITRIPFTVTVRKRATIWPNVICFDHRCVGDVTSQSVRIESIINPFEVCPSESVVKCESGEVRILWNGKSDLNVTFCAARPGAFRSAIPIKIRAGNCEDTLILTCSGEVGEN